MVDIRVNMVDINSKHGHGGHEHVLHIYVHNTNTAH
jgi:hypothetical protein